MTVCVSFILFKNGISLLPILLTRIYGSLINKRSEGSSVLYFQLLYGKCRRSFWYFLRGSGLFGLGLLIRGINHLFDLKISTVFDYFFESS